MNKPNKELNAKSSLNGTMINFKRGSESNLMYIKFQEYCYERSDRFSLSSVGKSEWLRGFPLNLTRTLYHISFKKSTDFSMFFKYFLKNFSS